MTQSNPPKDPKAQAAATGKTLSLSKLTIPVPSMENLEEEAERSQDELTVITKVPEEIIKEAPDKRDRMYLLVISGNLMGQMFPLDGTHFQVGRSTECEISLRDNDISRVHARIELLPDQTVILYDNGSTNGTFVNGRRLQHSQGCRLRDGDRIQLGRSTILKFSMHDELEELFQRRLYESAVLDGLTQLYNRKFFDERIESEFSFARRHRTPLSILLMDIDFFKRINDTKGHPMGDRVLRIVAQTIRSVVRNEDIVARYGGEEFAVIARGILPTQAAILAERIRSKVEELDISLETGGSIRVTLSVGAVTLFNDVFDTPAELLQEADDRLYCAKRFGRNQVVAERVNL